MWHRHRVLSRPSALTPWDPARTPTPAIILSLEMVGAGVSKPDGGFCKHILAFLPTYFYFLRIWKEKIPRQGPGNQAILGSAGSGSRWWPPWWGEVRLWHPHCGSPPAGGWMVTPPVEGRGGAALAPVGDPPSLPVWPLPGERRCRVMGQLPRWRECLARVLCVVSTGMMLPTNLSSLPGPAD